MNVVDLDGVEGRIWDGDPARRLIVLPGALYTTDAPLLWFAREKARSLDWSVLQIWDRYDGEEDRDLWGRHRLDLALAASPGVRLVCVVAKSLTTLALPLAAERNLPGVWLTPLMGTTPIATGLAAIRAPTLLVGGTADESWDPGLVPASPTIEVLEIEGGDHVLQVAGDMEASLSALRTVIDAISNFLIQLD